jgi:NADH-quinone oxidoreductase subunit N
MVPGTVPGIASSIFHMYIYLVTSILFFCLYFLYYAELGFALIYNSNLLGLGVRKPVLACLFTVVFFSMAGFPPFIGFFTKYFIFSATMSGGFFFLTLYAIILSVVNSFVYLRLIKIMWFETRAVGGVHKEDIFEFTVSLYTIAFILSGLLVFFIIKPNMYIDILVLLIDSLIRPQGLIYSSAHGF